MRVIQVFALLFLVGCSGDKLQHSPLFTDVTKQCGIDFRNNLSFTERLNPYTYRNFYNGAGVAIGDINNDGLLDIYFTGNQVDNKLYLNEGNFVFKDITAQAGVACGGVWSTGVTFADINADGFLDIYVCKSGDPDVPHRNNELFINNGDLTFTERSKEYGLDIIGLSIQAAFFDFDKDNDLDCYLLTNSIRSVGNYDLIKDQREIPDPQNAGNKFFINENGTFRDYSEEAQIYRSPIGFGLGITLGDFNGDSWTDIFVSNDFFERDYLYINNQHGAFVESLTQYFQSISMGSMGADFADLDNDGISELFVTEMLPDSLHRRKTKTLFDTWDKYQLNVKNGYHHQFSRNVLQKKTGDNNYAEIGRLTGMAASEWSWGALLFDMDNDGYRDVFIANGIYKDLLDRDYLAYTGADANVRKIIREEKEAIVKLIDLIPSSRFLNYVFRNEGNFNFRNVGKEWGFSDASVSSGSAYGDLDNDGDVDLVVSNINSPSKVYRNNSDTSEYKSITVMLSAHDKNTFAVGSEITAFCGSRKFTADNFVTRGYQSSVPPHFTIGLGKDVSYIDSLVVKWPDNNYSVLYSVAANQRLTIRKENTELSAMASSLETQDEGIKLKLVADNIFRHQGNHLVDFNRDRLLPMMYSNETPSMVKGDVDNDGIEEVYVGGGKGQPGSFIQYSSGTFHNHERIKLNDLCEETKNAFADVDGDGDLDLYSARGGRFFPKTSSVLMDKIFLNNGSGNFVESSDALPFKEFVATSVVKSIDFDKDGDIDLFIGERFDPFVYGMDGRGYLFENDGSGRFVDVTGNYAPALADIGMITDANIQDVDNDGWSDLVIVGDWMSVVILKNDRGRFTDISDSVGLRKTKGWWKEIESADLNKDGKPDFVLGNHGANSFFKAGDRMYVADFDKNGSIEQIFCTNIDGKYYPVVDRDELLSQLPALKKKLLYYKDYSTRTIDDLFPKEVLDDAKIFQVDILYSALVLSRSGGYEVLEMPSEAQYSPIYGLLIKDVDNDGVEDVIAGGNQYQSKPQFGRYDASNGWLFKGTLDNQKFSLKPGTDLNVKGQIRDIEFVEINGVNYILFAKYDDDVEIYKISL